ncbi:MAG TPA: iron-sulfur cluster insertion protein ErpA [Deinococcales bacterium]|nr:iron-sulfur cluster insertion protein ErpA [Deinococcales bacterium]
MIEITENGAQKAREILQRNGKEHARVRVFVKSGGCSGYSYGMAIDERDLDGDMVVESHGVNLVVDRMSAPYLTGAVVDYIENMMGGGFSVVSNPNATSSCGCGHSFRTDGAAAPEGEGSSCSSTRA